MKKNGICMKPNILLILVDSFRADKCFGENKTSKIPNIEKLIKKGVYFEQAIGSSDYTVTGYGSIFSGLFPIDAGNSGMDYHKIFSKIPNYISYLKNQGYHSYSLIASDEFENITDFSNFFENDEKSFDRAKTGLFFGLDSKILSNFEKEKMEEPWFYFIHLEDLHLPVRVPEKHKGKKYNERYDLAVSEIDNFIGKILEKIDLENTLLILTADHGDYILSGDDSIKDNFNQKVKTKLRTFVPKIAYDKASIIKRNTQRQIKISTTKNPLEKRAIDSRTAKNRYLFDELIHVPLLFAGHNVPSRNTISDLVRLVDVFPTILDLTGVKTPNREIHGRSLLPLLKGEKMEEEPVYLENTIFQTSQKSPNACVGIRSSKFKYFRSLKNPKENVHLYDLTVDPLEISNIANKKPEIISGMEKQIKKIKENSEKIEFDEMSKEEKNKIEEELKKLGYI
ncbi:MAG: hypothetical protein CMD65_05245 [Gammaproteobacteria bacterium]|nr:hypothetical protein [Gammaproteobacteria bacterium]